MENKKKKNVEKVFEGYIEKIFGKDCLKEIEPLYKKVIENRDNNVKCGKYGDDPATIELILYLRHKMRENKLISSEPISNYLKRYQKRRKIVKNSLKISLKMTVKIEVG